MNVPLPLAKGDQKSEIASETATHEAGKDQPDIAKKSPWVGLTALLSILSLLSIALASLGYGMTFAAESVFGIPHATLFASVFELIDLSALPILSVVDGGGRIVFDVRALFTRAPASLYLVVLALLALWLVMLLVVVPTRWRPVQQLLKRAKTLRPRDWYRLPRVGDSWSQCGKSFVWPLTASVGFLLAAWISLVLVCGFAAALSLLPLFGYELGQAHLRRWVVEADVCTPLKTASQRTSSMEGKRVQGSGAPDGKTRRVVACVSLIREGRIAITGRVIAASSSAIAVYDPATGAVRRESLAGLSVQVVEF